MLTRVISAALVLAAAVVVPVSTKAGDYEAAANAAYCHGALARSLVINPNDKSISFADRRGDEQSRDRHQIFARGAMEQKLIDQNTVLRLSEVGDADWILCAEYMKTCADLSPIAKQRDDMKRFCDRKTHAACRRVDACG